MRVGSDLDATVSEQVAALPFLSGYEVGGCLSDREGGRAKRPGRLANPSGGADVTEVRTFVLSCTW